MYAVAVLNELNERFNKIVKDNDPALVDSFGISSLCTSKHVFVNCFHET